MWLVKEKVCGYDQRPCMVVILFSSSVMLQFKRVSLCRVSLRDR